MINPYTRMPAQDSAPEQPEVDPTDMIQAAAQADAAGVPMPPQLQAIAKKGVQTKKQQTNTQKADQKTSQNTYLSPDDVSAQLESLRQLPTFKSQEEAIEDAKKSLSMAQGMRKFQPSAATQPLMALADAWTGSHLAQSYQAPDNSKRDKMIADSQNKVDTQTNNYNKTLLEGLTKLKSGTTTQGQSNINVNLDGINTGMGQSGYGEARRNSLIAKSGQDFDNDPILKTFQTTTNNLDRATSMMNGKTPITGKNFALLQQDMINAMAPGGAATEGKVNREMVTTLAATLNDVQQRFGSIKDLRKEQPQVFAQLQGLINQVHEDYNQAANQRMLEKEANWRNVPDDAVQKTVDSKLALLRSKFPKKSADSGAPDYNSMTNAQLADYVKNHPKNGAK